MKFLFTKALPQSFKAELSYGKFYCLNLCFMCAKIAQLGGEGGIVHSWLRQFVKFFYKTVPQDKFPQKDD